MDARECRPPAFPSVCARQYHYNTQLTKASHVTHKHLTQRGAYMCTSGPRRRYVGILHHAPRVAPSCADMPHADHALAHAAPAFPGAGSCLERVQPPGSITRPRDATRTALPGRCLSSAPSASHRLTLTLPREPSLQRWCVSIASQPAASLARAVQADARSHSAAWLIMSPALRAPLRVGWPPRCTTRGRGRQCLH